MATRKHPYILGVIPARAGSKRLPGKNIKLLNGHPLIKYAIKTGLRSKYINRLIVSTDCGKIKKVAIKSGASVPFLRPKELANDSSPTESVVKHAVVFMENSLGKKIDIVVLLQATCPFTTVDAIDSCVELLLKEDWDTVITVKEVSHRAEWTGFINNKGGFEQIISEKEYFKLAKTREYAPSGNIYVFKREVLFEQKKIIGRNTGTVVVSPESAVDIDVPLDFMFAEFLLKN